MEESTGLPKAERESQQLRKEFMRMMGAFTECPMRKGQSGRL